MGVKQADDELEQMMTKLKQVEEECAASEDLKGFDQKEVPRLKQRHSRAQGRTEKVLIAVKGAYEKAVRKAYAELEEMRTEAVKATRMFMTSEGKTGEQLFTHINGGEALTRDKFVEFIKGLSELKLEDGQAERIFDHIVMEAKEISKQQFMEMIRLYYKCVKATVLSEEVSIKSKTVRRLDCGEVLEALEGPAKE